jgi:hypothetical protein
MAEKIGPEFVVQDVFLGMVVTGYLVSAEKYFNGMSELFEEVISEDSPEAVEVRRVFDTFLKTMAEDSAKAFREAEEEDDETLISYINLRDAQFFVGDKPVPANRKVWWRGRLSSVDGFNLGTLSPERV